MNYPYQTNLFTVPTHSSDKNLGSVTSINNKPIVFFSKRLINMQHNYYTLEKKINLVVPTKGPGKGIKVRINT